MERFFRTGSKIDEINVKELLLRRYHDYNVIMSMEISGFIHFLDCAIEKEFDEKLYFRWCVQVQHMSEPCSFKEFKDILTGQNIDTRPEEEILNEILAAHKRMGGGALGYGDF